MGQRRGGRTAIRVDGYSAHVLDKADARLDCLAVKPYRPVAFDWGKGRTVYFCSMQGRMKMNDSRTQPKSRVLMMPRDTNPAGTIFGGVILSYIDQAGAEEARYQGAERVVTVAMKEVVFLQPVFVGDLVSFYTELVRVGKTSITVRVMVTAARRWDRAEEAQVTEAEITYVNIDADHRPTPLKLSTQPDSD